MCTCILPCQERDEDHRKQKVRCTVIFLNMLIICHCIVCGLRVPVVQKSTPGKKKKKKKENFSFWLLLFLLLLYFGQRNSPSLICYQITFGHNYHLPSLELTLIQLDFNKSKLAFNTYL